MKLQEMNEIIPARNKELVLYAKHVLTAFDAFEDHHRRYTAAQALAGIQPNGKEESVFYETLQDVRRELLRTLEFTIQDIMHKGDKAYENHFKDGVE